MGDLGPVRVPDLPALLRYADGVAGTVGLMMSDLLGARDRARAAPRARDLGVAMQLTNVARDVEEDARRGRIYLPADRLPPGTSPADLLRDGPARAAAWDAVLDLLGLAGPYYRSAERGLPFLAARPRLAVLVAARLYEAIGTRIRRGGPGAYWGRRAALPPAAKAALTAAAVARLFAGPARPARDEARP